LYLDDSIIDTFTDDSLPLSPPPLSNFARPLWALNFRTSPTSGVAVFGPISSFSVVAIPEPKIYAMMSVGLGLVGLAARRKKRKTA